MDAGDSGVASLLGGPKSLVGDGEVLFELGAESVLDVERSLSAACVKLRGLPGFAQRAGLGLQCCALGARSLLGTVGAVDGALGALLSLLGAALRRLRLLFGALFVLVGTLCVVLGRLALCVGMAGLLAGGVALARRLAGTRDRRITLPLHLLRSGDRLLGTAVGVAG